MEKQSNLKKFLKVVTQSGQIFDDSDMDIENFDAKSPNQQKKQPNVIVFLKKIDQKVLEILEKYLVQSKIYLQCTARPKIGLYEDILIISQYRKALQNLKAQRTKTLDIVADKLHSIIKRSKVTIKERICKRLCRLSVEDVLQAIKQKKDFAFDKNQKKKLSNIIKKQSDSATKSMKIQSANSIQSISSVNNCLITNSKQVKEQIKLTEIKKNVKTSLYNYGKKQIKNRIYFLGNNQKNILIRFNQLNFNEIKKKYQIQTNFNFNDQLIKDKQQFNKSAIMPQGHKSENKIIAQQLNNLSKPVLQNQVELQKYIQKMKTKVNQMVNNGQGEQKGVHSKLQQYLQEIQDLQQKLTTINTNQSNLNQDQQIQSQKSVNLNKQNSTGKKTSDKSTPSKTTKDELSQEKNLKLLHQLGNNIKYAELIKDNHELYKKYIWQQDQDDLLFSFNFNPQAYRIEMACLLRYKSKELIEQRMKYLNLSNMNMIEQMNKLQVKGSEQIPQVSQELIEAQ